VSGLSSFKNFKNQTTGCGDIAYSPVGYFILSHPVQVGCHSSSNNRVKALNRFTITKEKHFV